MPDLDYTLRFCYDSARLYETYTDDLYNPYGPYTEDVQDDEVEEIK